MSVPRYAIEIPPPDISRRRLARGDAPEFLHVFDSCKDGPNVMIQALTHGNEVISPTINNINNINSITTIINITTINNITITLNSTVAPSL